jgi:Family of unknown function (DUF6387)
VVKRLKHVSQLPEWFDLQKYEGASLLDAAGWYEQLNLRKDLITSVGSPRWKETPSEVVLDILQQVRKNPIVDFTNSESIAVYSGRAMIELKHRDLHYLRGVHLTTVRELYLAENNIDKDKRTHARNFFTRMFDGSESWLSTPSIECKDWIDEPIDGITASRGFTVNIKVNLLLPDKLLIEQFKQTLNKLRSPLNKVGITLHNTQKPIFSDWVNLGVLPYLDLKIWQQETESTIPNRVMADAIFPPGEGGDDTVRKTTEKYADDLLTDKHLITLASIAATEIAERNKG